MNGAFIEVFLHRLTDGGSLIRIMNADGTTESKVVYMREEVESYVVSVGGKTCVFDKENDPTIMRASSAGKLVRYLVEDGEHVKTGQAFAEVEVMKMVMSVHAKASGCIQHVQLGGAILASGNLIATMKLDNPDQVKTATPFTGVFPGATTGGDKPPGEVHEQFKTAHTFCFNVLRGFALPAPVFKTRLATYLDLLMLHSSSREVPLLEARIIIATLNGRIPAAVEASIVDELGNYERSTSSIICKFPTQRLAMIIDAHATTLDSSDQNAFFLTVLPLQDLIQQFRLGTNGRFVSLVTMMINEYLEIEGSFLNTSLEEAADKLKASAGGDLKAVVDAIIAHTQLANKNHMMIEILERIFTAGQTILKGNGKGANQDAMLFEALEKLARLTAAPTAPVALKARQFLIQLQCPEFDTRRKDLEATFTDLQSPEPVENLVKQGTSVFDVLSEFFYHENPVVQQSALEVYVRRAYVAYEIRKITFIKVAKSNNVVVWQ
jgi:biotin carboxyl carrier protein